MLALSLLAGLFQPALWLISVGTAVLLLALNWPLYYWFAGKRGWPFALLVIPWHWLYYLYNGLSFSVGAAQHVAGRRRPQSHDAKQPVIARD